MQYLPSTAVQMVEQKLFSFLFFGLVSLIPLSGGRSSGMNYIFWVGFPISFCLVSARCANGSETARSIGCIVAPETQHSQLLPPAPVYCIFDTDTLA